MEIKVNFLDKLRLEAKFDDFTVVADQPIRYKGDGSAPGPFDYFLASSALCAAYFVKLYCETRNIPTDNIRLSHNNIVDPENRYKQIFKIQVELPADISAADRQGILRSIERCTVKKVVQTGPEFVIEEVDNLDADAQAFGALGHRDDALARVGDHRGLEVAERLEVAQLGLHLAVVAGGHGRGQAAEHGVVHDGVQAIHVGLLGQQLVLRPGQGHQGQPQRHQGTRSHQRQRGQVTARGAAGVAAVPVSR